MVRATALKRVTLKEEKTVTEKTMGEGKKEQGWKRFICKITGGRKNEK